ncbi:rRNA maturation RNase YbeY [Siccirubricoccus sp. KC 17139]|uniref:Endoribonuclease YbeY n=1 Tax=Siccirubricoccus soli TaxID=2899147 RepID=A0ABT1D1X5_9PROT|nr:rRNA maturation RNase YbeY [Siccirubricoccus soli]MCO6415894.1 rRNA maturation RNase YbeY [Siccirubricoccus soli]MCP2682026.1 rRNA maturation RNase YbeY [Siccirubricoccus soli]
MEPGSRSPGEARGTPPADAGFSEGDEAADTGLTVSVILEAPGWRRALPRVEALARRAAAAALAESGTTGHVTVLLADDRALKRLNAEHRGKEKPTNVLSFPGYGPEHLGDIALALGVVAREAKAAGKRLAVHFAHLVAHGTLHLIGHDHLTAGEARRMERAEARALHRLRLPNPWRGVGA